MARFDLGQLAPRPGAHDGYPGAANRREGQRGEKGDDGNDDQQLDQGEGPGGTWGVKRET